jgi:hypothetical protein
VKGAGIPNPDRSRPGPVRRDTEPRLEGAAEERPIGRCDNDIRKWLAELVPSGAALLTASSVRWRASIGCRGIGLAMCPIGPGRGGRDRVVAGTG